MVRLSRLVKTEDLIKYTYREDMMAYQDDMHDIYHAGFAHVVIRFRKFIIRIQVTKGPEKSREQFQAQPQIQILNNQSIQSRV